MKKLEEIKKTLEFYVLANKLKTTFTDEDNIYSVADNIFGSMMLAIAMDSEFKETDNIGRLLRMMVLSEFSKLNPDYSIEDNLKKGKQYKEEINEVNLLQTKDAKLIYKYKMLDQSLTKLLSDLEGVLEYQDLLEEGIKILRPQNSEELSKYEEIFRFYYLNFKLKNLVRTGWNEDHWNINSKRIERISEHVVGTLALAIVMDSEFDYNEEIDFCRNIDIDRILKMLALHELGETLIGDYTPFDNITKEEKKEIENKARVEAIGNLSEKNNLLEMFWDFEEKFSNEARFSYFCDKIEADLQSRFYQDCGLHNSLDNQSNNRTFKSPKAIQILQDGAKTPFDMWYGLDMNIYKDSQEFPEFADMLKLVRDNNLFTLSSGTTKQKIDLSEEEFNYLVEKIGKVAKILHEDDRVDCLYLATYQNEDNDKGRLCFMTLLNVDAYYSGFELLMDKINDFFESKNNGFIIDFYYDYTDDYFIAAPIEIKLMRLADSSIIFDKSGKVTEIKNANKEYQFHYPVDLVEYEPPIDKTLIYKFKNN